MDDLDGPPPPRNRKGKRMSPRYHGKRHRWVWSGFDVKDRDIYKCKDCGKTKVI